MEDYSASKHLSYDSELEREYAKVNRTTPTANINNAETVKSSKSRCTSLFESERREAAATTITSSRLYDETLTKFSQSVSITYRTPNPNLTLYQLLGILTQLYVYLDKDKLLYLRHFFPLKGSNS